MPRMETLDAFPYCVPSAGHIWAFERVEIQYTCIQDIIIDQMSWQVSTSSNILPSWVPADYRVQCAFHYHSHKCNRLITFFPTSFVVIKKCVTLEFRIKEPVVGYNPSTVDVTSEIQWFSFDENWKHETNSMHWSCMLSYTTLKNMVAMYTIGENENNLIRFLVMEIQHLLVEISAVSLVVEKVGFSDTKFFRFKFMCWVKYLLINCFQIWCWDYVKWP